MANIASHSHFEPRGTLASGGYGGQLGHFPCVKTPTYTYQQFNSPTCVSCIGCPTYPRTERVPLASKQHLESLTTKPPPPGVEAVFARQDTGQQAVQKTWR